MRRLVALLSLAPLSALAQTGACDTVPPVDTVGGAVAGLIGGADPLVAFLSSGFVASAIIIGALMWLRRALPARFAPDPSTEAARLWNMGTALVLGLVLGLATIAPAVPIPGRELVGPVLVIARLLGGFLCATAAVFGRDFYTRGQGALDERKASKLASMTTGEFRALRDDDKTGGGAP